jgi:hypothetical protein
LNFSLFKQFNLAWYTPHHFVLKDKVDPWFCIVCQTAELPQEPILAQCNQIKEQLKQIRTHKKNAHHTTHIADIRFAHQIVLTEQSYATAVAHPLGMEREIHFTFQGEKGDSHV